MIPFLIIFNPVIVYYINPVGTRSQKRWHTDSGNEQWTWEERKGHCSTERERETKGGSEVMKQNVC